MALRARAGAVFVARPRPGSPAAGPGTSDWAPDSRRPGHRWAPGDSLVPLSAMLHDCYARAVLTGIRGLPAFLLPLLVSAPCTSFRSRRVGTPRPGIGLAGWSLGGSSPKGRGRGTAASVLDRGDHHHGPHWLARLQRRRRRRRRRTDCRRPRRGPRPSSSAVGFAAAEGHAALARGYTLQHPAGGHHVKLVLTSLCLILSALASESAVTD